LREIIDVWLNESGGNGTPALLDGRCWDFWALDVPRAMEAVDADHPHGTPGYNNNGYTVLQQHIAFFDRNNDGVIYPWETFQGTIPSMFVRFQSC